MDLNIRQKKVVHSEAPHILCLASAGSGKTRTLTERVRYLLKQGADPTKMVAITFTNLAAGEMKTRLGKECAGMFIGTIHSYANYICIKNGLDTQQYIINKEFDKIIKRALTLNTSSYDEIDYLFVDECQDISELEYTFLKRLPVNADFYVGDEKQCQPAGTKIMLRNHIIKNIEDIQVGDSIVYYDTPKAYMCGVNIIPGKSIEKKVQAIAHRTFVNDNLITVKTENGLTSSYTPNHRAMVKISGSKKNHAVYLMCDENYRFRVGKIPFAADRESGYHKNPWREKMYQEGCTKIWILDVFETDLEARVLEQRVSYYYQIPQICWQLNKVQWTQEHIDYIYEGIDTKANAERCLKDFNRDINYPLLDKQMEQSERIHYARNALAPCYACNIMPEIMEVLVFDEKDKKRKHYERITEVKNTFITEPIEVYSLKVEDETYIADRILTHNSIYGFKGCSDQYLYDMANNPEYSVYYLTQNYRNAPNIIKKANSYLMSFNGLSPFPEAVKTENGLVEECNFLDALDDLEDSGNWGIWFILARTNIEVEAIMEMLDERNIPNVTFKKGDLNEMELEELMSENRVKVLTIHSAKGLETKRAIVCGVRTYNEEERKIAYVAMTRPENALYICPAIKRRKHGKQRMTGKTEAGDVFGKTGTTMVSF